MKASLVWSLKIIPKKIVQLQTGLVVRPLLLISVSLPWSGTRQKGQSQNGLPWSRNLSTSSWTNTIKVHCCWTCFNATKFRTKANVGCYWQEWGL